MGEASMKEKIKPGQPGTTRFVVSFCELMEPDSRFAKFPEWAQWGILFIRDDKHLQFEVWIANEFIDWVHYRETSEYQPVKFLEFEVLPPVEVPIWLPEQEPRS